MNNDVVIYQSADGLVKIEAIVDASNETIWATQKAIASLLGVDRTVITRHLSNIFKEGELDKEVVCAKIAQTTPHGAMEGEFQTRDVQFYNLDAIISVEFQKAFATYNVMQRMKNIFSCYGFPFSVLPTVYAALTDVYIVWQHSRNCSQNPISFCDFYITVRLILLYFCW